MSKIGVNNPTTSPVPIALQGGLINKNVFEEDLDFQAGVYVKNTYVNNPEYNFELERKDLESLTANEGVAGEPPSASTTANEGVAWEPVNKSNGHASPEQKDHAHHSHSHDHKHRHQSHDRDHSHHDRDHSRSRDRSRDRKHNHRNDHHHVDHNYSSGASKSPRDQHDYGSGGGHKDKDDYYREKYSKSEEVRRIKTQHKKLFNEMEEDFREKLRNQEVSFKGQA